MTLAGMDGRYKGGEVGGSAAFANQMIRITLPYWV